MALKNVVLIRRKSGFAVTVDLKDESQILQALKAANTAHKGIFRDDEAEAIYGLLSEKEDFTPVRQIDLAAYGCVNLAENAQPTAPAVAQSQPDAVGV